MVFAQRLACLGGLLAGCLPLSACAHAILLDSQPPARAQIQPGAVVFSLHYNARIDHARSRLTLVAADRSEQRLAIAPTSGLDSLTTGVVAAPGAWVLRWQVLALDGHITRGDLPFSVAAGS